MLEGITPFSFRPFKSSASQQPVNGLFTRHHLYSLLLSREVSREILVGRSIGHRCGSSTQFATLLWVVTQSSSLMVPALANKIVSRFPSNLNELSLVILSVSSKLSGTVPVRSLSAKSPFLSSISLASADHGTFPLKSLLLRLRYKRSRSFPSSDGIDPDSLLTCR